MERLLPAAKQNNVAVVFSTNRHFLPYLAVTIRSLLEHGAKGKHFDLMILHSELSGADFDGLRAMTAAYNHCTLRFYDVSALCGHITFFTEGGNGMLTRESYYRLLIGDILSEEYEKVLYLDGDVVVRADVSCLLEEVPAGCYLAAVQDVGMIGLTCDPKEEKKAYMETVLGIRDAASYFNAGVLVLNLHELRRDWPSERLLKLAAERNWEHHDQDILNHICAKGCVKYLPQAWNTMHYNNRYRFLPLQIRLSLCRAYLAPKLIHYAGSQKPWNSDCPRDWYFWRTAVNTGFLGDVLCRMTGRALSAAQVQEISGKILGRKLPASYTSIVLEAGGQPDTGGLAGRLISAVHKRCPRLSGFVSPLIWRLYDFRHGSGR